MGKKRPPSGPDEVEKSAEPPAAPKRQRVSRACDQCRSAREKCDGMQPLCFPCASQNRSCSWQEPKKKRGVQMGYIRALEMALGWMFDKIPGSETALHNLLTHEGGQGRALLEGKDSGVGNRLHRRWRRSIVHEEVDRVLSGGDAAQSRSSRAADTCEKSEDSDDEDVKHGHLSDEPIVLPLPQDAGLDSRDLDRNQNPYQPQRRSNSSSHPESGYPSPPDARERSSSTEPVKLPSNHWKLLDVYFSYTHSWFPIIEKHVLLRTSYTYPAEGKCLSRDDSSLAGHAELWAALALASYQEEASRTSAGAERSGTSPEVQLAPSRIYAIAQGLLPSGKSCHDPRCVNALLLLALIGLAQEDLTAAWYLVGRAVRVALRLGLHRIAVNDQNRSVSHTYMGCFILDTMIASRLDLPPHLRAHDARLVIPPPEKDMDEWQPWIPCQGFGPPQQLAIPSRNPSHAVSSISSLFGIYRVLSSEPSLIRGELTQNERAYSAEAIRNMSATNDAQHFNSFVITGEPLVGVCLPSLYILRLSFLCVGAQLRALPSHIPSLVLATIEEYISIFGICGLPPLISSYMAIVDQSYPTHFLAPEARKRWLEIRHAARAVWGSSSSAHPDEANVTAPSQTAATNELLASAALPNVPIQQIPTPSSFQTDHSVHAPTSGMASANYQSAPSEVGSGFYQVERPRTHPQRPATAKSASSTMAVATPATSGAFFPGAMEMQTTISPAAGQPLVPTNPLAGGSTTLDYDAILDDIASFDRTDMIESDPQFMANLGFAPGSNLSDLFSNEFIEFP